MSDTVLVVNVKSGSRLRVSREEADKLLEAKTCVMEKDQSAEGHSIKEKAVIAAAKAA